MQQHWHTGLACSWPWLGPASRGLDSVSADVNVSDLYNVNSALAACFSGQQMRAWRGRGRGGVWGVFPLL